MKISGGSPLSPSLKGRKGDGPTWIFCPGAPEFIVTPMCAVEDHI